MDSGVIVTRLEPDVLGLLVAALHIELDVVALLYDFPVAEDDPLTDEELE